ncbi:MAG: bifunctional folylpolyglutamate synthase/dihydrofolate synthase [Candidatus Nanopelagicaceae bacterium]
MSINNLQEIERALSARWPETKIDPTLERIALLVDYLGSPQQSYPNIHIAGTNGKTSTSRIIDSLCQELGLRTGRFTSPHLESILERIAINGSPIDELNLIKYYREIEPYISLVDARMSHPLSFFEVMTALAFVTFAEFPVDVGIFECGMGGEWDSTNVIDSKVAVLTPIGFDHMEYLGNTLVEIATTKSGIIKEGEFAVLARQERDAAQVLLKRCAMMNATPLREGIEYEVVKRDVAVGGQLLTIRGIYGIYEDLFLPLHGKHQSSNAATALAAVEVFAGEKQLSNEIVSRAFANATSPGRCEIISREPTIIIDAAHNPHGAISLKQTLTGEFSFEKIILVFAAMADKDIPGFLVEMQPIVDELMIAKNSSPRSADIEEVKQFASGIFKNNQIYTARNLEEALQEAKSRASEMHQGRSVAILVSGSVVTAGEMRALVKRKGQ